MEKFISGSLLFLFLSYFPTAVFAQAITIIGSSGDARNCSMAADMASKFSFVSRDDLDSCTRAIDYGHLKQTQIVIIFRFSL